MALRTLPFRQYNESDVINMFALGTEYINNAVTDSGYGDAGVVVTVESGNLNLGPVIYDSTFDSYLGKTDYPHVGVNQYPRVPLTVKPATSGNGLLGMTLLQTAKYDENGEKLLYYRQKAEDLMCLLPGQAVPIATRGMFSLTDAAYVGAVGIGSGLKLASGVSGKLTGCAYTDVNKVATVFATGSRTPSTSVSDQFAGTGTGNFAIVGLGL